MYGPNHDQTEPGAYEVIHGYECACGAHRVHGGHPVYTKQGLHTRYRCPGPSPAWQQMTCEPEGGDCRDHFGYVEVNSNGTDTPWDRVTGSVICSMSSGIGHSTRQ